MTELLQHINIARARLFLYPSHNEYFNIDIMLYELRYDKNIEDIKFNFLYLYYSSNIENYDSIDLTTLIKAKFILSKYDFNLKKQYDIQLFYTLLYWSRKYEDSLNRLYPNLFSNIREDHSIVLNNKFWRIYLNRAKDLDKYMYSQILKVHNPYLQKDIISILDIIKLINISDNSKQLKLIAYFLNLSIEMQIFAFACLLQFCDNCNKIIDNLGGTNLNVQFYKNVIKYYPEIC